MDLSKIKNIHMIGIKGVGMTMLAQYLAATGKNISGSDIPDVFMTDKVLSASGIKVKQSFGQENIEKGTELVIYSSAYNPETNAELKAAFDKGLKTICFAEAFSAIFNSHYGIAVTGSHGKTTTTAWLGYVMDKALMSPSVFVGSEVPQWGGLSLAGKSDYLVAELDEYQNKLRYFQPKMVLLNNIDYDHPDFFPTKDDYNQAFIEFIQKIPKKGLLVANFDDPLIRKYAPVNCRSNIVTYAIHDEADYVAYDIKRHGGRQFFKVKLASDAATEDIGETELGGFSIRLSGEHNILNALGVIAAGVELGIELSVIRNNLEEFAGTARRMQVLGAYRGATIIDDYAHHPTEIRATLKGVRDLYPDKRLVLAFHPHTFTRTKALLNDFSQAFDLADELILLDIYGSAREIQGGVSSEDLLALTNEHLNSIGSNTKTLYIPSLEECEEYLRSKLGRGDVLVLMGAGDIFRIGNKLIE